MTVTIANARPRFPIFFHLNSETMLIMAPIPGRMIAVHAIIFAAISGTYPNVSVKNPASNRIIGPASMSINPIMGNLFPCPEFVDGISDVTSFAFSMLSILSVVLNAFEKLLMLI